MKFQLATFETLPDAVQDSLRLLFRIAMRHNIVCVTLERYFRVRCTHPVVEAEMQEDVGQ